MNGSQSLEASPIEFYISTKCKGETPSIENVIYMFCEGKKRGKFFSKVQTATQSMSS